MRYHCRQCGALGPTIVCDSCGYDNGIRALLARLRNGGQRKYDAPRRRRWWHLPTWRG